MTVATAPLVDGHDSWNGKQDRKRQRLSQAFQRFVNSDEHGDDVTGLLAYALFKQAVREDAMAGNPLPASRRTPSRTMVQAYRGAADQILSGVINRALADKAPAIKESALHDELRGAVANLRAHIDARTSWKTGVTTNLVAWLISLAIVVLVLVTFTSPDMSNLIRDAVTPDAHQERR